MGFVNLGVWGLGLNLFHCNGWCSFVFWVSMELGVPGLVVSRSARHEPKATRDWGEGEYWRFG